MTRRPAYNELARRVKALERELADKKGVERKRYLIEKTNEVIYSLDMTGRFTYVSPSSLILTGYIPEEVMGRPFAEFVHPDDLPFLLDRFKGVLSGETLSSDYRIVDKNRDVHWVYSSTSPTIENGRVVAVQGVLTDITERKRAEEALKESEERFSGMFEHTSSGVVIYESVDNGEDFVFRAFNPAAERITRISRSEALGHRLLDLFPNMNKTGLLGALQRVWKTGQEEHLLPFYYKDDKRKGWRENRIFKLPTGEVVALFNDVTNEKQAEEALRESEEKYRNLVEESFDGIFIQKGTRIIFANKRLNEMLGYKEGELIGQNHWVVYHPDYQKLTRERAQARMGGGQAVSRYEVKLQRKDGSWFYGGINARPITFPSDKENGIQVWIKDITEQKLSEEALRQSEEKYRTILESIEDGYFEVDISGNLTFFNDSLCKILGYPKDELMGMNNRRYTDGETAKKLYETFNKVYTTGNPDKGFNWPIIRKDGMKAAVEASVSLKKNAKGEPTGFRGIVRDVSEKQRLEAQFQQAQKMEAIGTLAGGIAHDFNNLLMAIQGRASIMLMNKDSSHPDFEDLKGIEDHVNSAADLTRQLLGFARGGKYEVRATDLNELIMKENRLFGRTKKEIVIREEFEENIWPVEIDRGQIEQVLLNLYVNAWQAMPEGGDLYLETKNVTLGQNDTKPFSAEPGRYVKISVADTGSGIDKSTQEKIFDPFFTTKEMGRGTGLGLASSYGIIKNHGGFINVYSEKGHGATFNIYLPASEKEVSEEKLPSGTLLKGTETVLFVDDEDMVVEVAEELFKELGYKVLIARGGKEAIEIYEKNKDQIDMVLLDMIMPDMNGSDTFDRLKEINHDIKVILSSGYSLNDQASKVLNRGCNGFIQKPFRMKELSKKMREILDGK